MAIRIKQRQLSPHIIIYNPQLASMFSVFHRMSGILMVLGVSFLLIFVKVLNYYSSNYAFYSLGFFFLDYLYFGLALCIALVLSFHIANGIRHLVWDFGVVGFTIKEVFLSHKLVIFLCIVLFVRFVGLTIFSL